MPLAMRLASSEVRWVVMSEADALQIVTTWHDCERDALGVNDDEWPGAVPVDLPRRRKTSLRTA